MRNYTIDAFRFIAVTFVVIIHVSPYKDNVFGQILNQTARFAVPYFFIIAGFFFYRKIEDDHHNALKYFLHYGIRIFYVYFFWYIIYAIYPLFSPDNWGNISHNGFLNEFQNWKLQFLNDFSEHVLHHIAAGGRGGHLWFLPSLGAAIFLLAISLRFNLLFWGTIISIVLFILALLITPYKESTIGLDIHFDPRNGPLFSSIFVFVGAILSKHSINVSLRTALLITFMGFLIHMLEIFFIEIKYSIPLTSHNFVFGTLAYGTGVAMIAISNENIGTKYNRHLFGKMALGIYVSHVLIFRVLQSPALNIWPSSDLMKVVFCLLVSIMLTKLISIVPVIRRVVC